LSQARAPDRLPPELRTALGGLSALTADKPRLPPSETHWDQPVGKAASPALSNDSRIAGPAALFLASSTFGVGFGSTGAATSFAGIGGGGVFEGGTRVKSRSRASAGCSLALAVARSFCAAGASLTFGVAAATCPLAGSVPFLFDDLLSTPLPLVFDLLLDA